MATDPALSQSPPMSAPQMPLSDLEQPPPPPLTHQDSVDVNSPEPFSHEILSARERHFDELIRTLSQVITAMGVVCAAMYFLKDVLIPFFLALALKYLLTPLIDWLSCHGRGLPRPLAVFLSLFIALCVLLILAFILVKSISIFADRADFYGAQVSLMLTECWFCAWLPPDASAALNQSLQGLDLQHTMGSLVSDVSLSSLILSLLGSAAHVAENVLYIVLFLMFMLLGHGADERKTGVSAKIDKQIFIFIRGKVSIYSLMAAVHAAIYWWVGLELWLVFGVLAFFLSFIPNIGLIVSVLLPMPIVALEPSFSLLDVVITFVGPALAGTLAKDVIEPLVLGSATSLHPVAVILVILLLGSLWGVCVPRPRSGCRHRPARACPPAPLTQSARRMRRARVSAGPAW